MRQSHLEEVVGIAITRGDGRHLEGFMGPFNSTCIDSIIDELLGHSC